MKLLRKHSSPLIILLVTTFLAIQPLNADEIKIRVPAPPVPKIVLPAPPAMIWLAGPKVYVAHDSPHEIFYNNDQYYLFHGSVWYIGRAYNGPWRVIDVHRVPPGLRGYRHNHWGRYQSEAAHHFRDEHYRHERHPFYAGRPRERAYWKDRHHDQGRHRGEGNREKNDKHGRGRGHNKD